MWITTVQGGVRLKLSEDDFGSLTGAGKAGQ